MNAVTKFMTSHTTQAGVKTPASMDGKSLAHLLVTDLDAAPAVTAKHLLATQAPGPAAWRTELLVEYAIV
jgi:hypothetical protein